MLNQVILVGRLVDTPEVIDTGSGKKVSNIVLAVGRPYKNGDGVYETDFIKCELWNGIATNTSNYCKKGDIVGIKGRLETNSFTDKENNKKFVTKIVAEKVTFLSANKNIEKEKSEDR